MVKKFSSCKYVIGAPSSENKTLENVKFMNFCEKSAYWVDIILIKP